MQSVVFAWLVTLVLREPAEKVGFAQMALLLPGLFLMLYAGAIADRVGAARQAFWSQLLAACTPLLLIYSVLTDTFTYELLIVYALLTGVAQAFLTPARDGLLNYVAEGNIPEQIRRLQDERGLKAGDRALKGSVGREINSAERVANYM